MRLLPSLLLTLFLCPSALAQEDSRRLAEIEQGLMEARAADQPGLAFELLGVQGGEVLQALLAPARNRKWEQRLASLEAKLGNLNLRKLGPLNRARAEAMAAALLVERIQLDTHTSERWHALGFTRRVEHSVRSLAHASLSKQKASESLEAILAILEHLPIYWRAAEANLVAPLLEWNLVAAEHLMLLQEELAQLAARDLSKQWKRDDLARWEAILKSADESCTEFEQLLRTPPTRAGSPPSRLGPERWLRMVQAASGSQLTLPKTKWRCLNFIADLEQAHGQRWRVRSTREPMANPERHLESLTEAAGGFLGQAELLGEGRTPKLQAQFGKQRLDYATLQPLSALRHGRELYLFLATELRALDRAGLTAIALREALPQTWLTGKRALRQSRALSEGLALYATDWPLRVNWVDNPLDRVAGLRAACAELQLFEVARLLAALELHAEDYSQVEASELFRQRTAVSPERARREVQAATLDPLRGIGCLVWFELRALELELGEDQAGIRPNLEHIASYPQLRPIDRRLALGLGELK